MALLYDKVVSTVSRPPDERTDGMIEQILPWFRKKSELFKSQKTEIVKDILKNCQFQRCQRDFVIIKQGDKGDCFYIILSGSVAILIQTNLGEDGIQYDPNVNTDPFGIRKKKDLDRSLFGNFVGKIPAGRSFGELALINADCVRNASIIADEVCDLIIVNRDLYNSTLKSFQEKEFNEKKTFVEEYPLFRGWQARYRKQLAMSLRKEKITFDGLVVRQGAPVDGVCFLLSGQAKMLVDPVQHEVQYPDKFPVPDVDQLERVEIRQSIRREMNMSVPKSDERKYARAKSPNLTERKKSHKSVEMCVMGAVELIGDLELTFGLPTFAETCQCTEAAEVFILDQKNFERLVEKRNPQSLDLIRQNVHQKLKLRMTWINTGLPLFRYFLYKLDERQRKEQCRQKSSHRRRDFRLTIDYWKTGKPQGGPLIDMFGPGSVFYTIRMRNRNKGLLRGRNGLSRNQIGAYLARKSGQRNNAVTIREMVRKQFANDRDEDEENDENEPVDAVTAANDGANDYQYDEYSDDDVDGPRKPRRSKVLCENNSNRSPKGSEKTQKSMSGCSVDEFMNQELNNLTLSKLESRLEAWHTKVDKIEPERRPKSAKSHVVKLHRYDAEDNSKPFPGTKIVFKPKVRAKPSALELHLESVVMDHSQQQTPPPSAGDPGAGRSRDVVSRDVGSRDCDRCSWLDADKPVEEPDGRRWCTKRPLSSKSEMCRSPTVQLRRRPKSARNYTAEDYVHLKEELRRKQIAYKSILSRSNTCF